jgi:hypothetical protein
MASVSRAIPPSRSPSVVSASPRLFWVMAQSTGARAGSFPQGVVIGGDGLVQPRRPALPLAEGLKCIAEIVLGHGPIERSFRTRRESEALAIDVDRLGQRGIVAEFASLLKELACLTEHALRSLSLARASSPSRRRLQPGGTAAVAAAVIPTDRPILRRLLSSTAARLAGRSAATALDRSSMHMALSWLIAASGLVKENQPASRLARPYRISRPQNFPVLDARIRARTRSALSR